MTRIRALPLAFAGGLLLLLAPGLETWWADRQLPRYEGRSARAWFQRFHREHALDQVSATDPAALLECKTAFLEMQPSALPFLVQQALTPRSDSALRTNLHRFFSQTPPWAGRGLFAPDSFAPYAAWELIRTLRPPASQLLPLIEPDLGGNDIGADGGARFQSFHGVMLLGYCGPPSDVAAQRLIALLDTYRSPLNRSAITNSLQALAQSSPVARAWMLHSWTDANHGATLFRLARVLTPSDTEVIPRLESVLTGTNASARIRAAVGLLRIQPEHQGALAALIQLLPSPGQPSDPRQSDRKRSEDAALLSSTLQGMQDLRSEPLRLILEPLLRDEIQQWNPRGAVYRFIYPMSRLAPDHTEALLREAFEGEGGPIAAGFLLRLKRGDADATRRLVHALESEPGRNIIAFQFLTHLVSTNETGMRFLRDCLEHPGSIAQRGSGQRVSPDYLRTVARQALAEIRYREARQRRGLPEDTW